MNRNTKVTYEVFRQLEERLNGTHKEDDVGFYRTFKFTDAEGKELKFRWYKNLCNLILGDHTQIMFTHASIDGCWPNHAKANLNVGSEAAVHCVVPLELYPKPECIHEEGGGYPMSKCSRCGEIFD